MGTFTKTVTKFSVFEIFLQFFFTKYEWNVDMKNDFCSKIDQIMSMSNMPK